MTIWEEQMSITNDYPLGILARQRTRALVEEARRGRVVAEANGERQALRARFLSTGGEVLIRAGLALKERYGPGPTNRREAYR